MHFSQVTGKYTWGRGQLEPGTGTKYSFITAFLYSYIFVLPEADLQVLMLYVS